MFWGGVIAAIIWAVRRLSAPRPSDSSLGIQNERFDGGEIEQQEYGTRKAALRKREAISGGPCRHINVSYLRRLHWPHVVVVVTLSAVLVFSLVLGGGLYLRCGFQCDRYGLPVGPVTELNLKAHPEATLYYPNSKVLWSQVSPEQRDAGSGAGRASLHTNLEATGRGQMPSDMQAIRDWYSAYLKGHGWLATGQPGFESFVRGPRETFAVNFNVVSDPSGASGSSSGWLRYSIEYSIVTCAYLQYWHRDLAC